MLQNKQIRFNFYSNVIALIANALVGIYYTPYLLHQLGVIAYGVVPLALIINQYISVITGALTSAFTRFYSVSIQSGNYKKASKDISTSMIVVLIIIIIFSPFLILLIYKIDHIFSIPSQYVNSAKLLFLFTILSFFLSLITSLLNVTLYALNRLDLMNALKIIRNIFKLALVMFFFNMYCVDILYIGLSNLFTESIILMLSIVLFKKNNPSNILIRFSNINKTVLYSIFGMSSWIIIHQLGDTGLYRIDNIIVNKFWSITDSGILGAITEFGSYVILVISVVGSIFGPLILIAYSKNDHEEVKNLALNQSYIVGCLAAILAGTVAGFSASLLRVWLGESFEQYSNWLLIKLISIPFYASGGVLAFVNRAWNRVKLPAYGTLFLGLCNLLIIYIVASSSWIGKSIEIILIISVVFAIIQSYYLNGYCMNLIYKGNFNKLIISSLKFGLIFFLSLILGKAIENQFLIRNVYLLFFALTISGSIIFFVVFRLFFKLNQRNLILSLLK